MFPLQRLALVTLAGALALTAMASTTSAFATDLATTRSNTDALAFAPHQTTDLGLRAPDSRDDEVILADFTPDRAPSRDGTILVGDLTTAPQATSSTPALNNTFKAGVGCSIQCITSGVAYARDAGVMLRVKTDTYAKIRINVWDDDHFWTQASSPGSLQFDATFMQLEAGATYHARVVATDGQYYQSVADGQFTTLNRYVEVSFSTAHVIDHAFSNSDFDKYVWANGEWLGVYNTYGLNLMEDNNLYWGDNTIYLGESPRYLDLAVQLIETDLSSSVVEASAPGDVPAQSFDSSHAYAYAELWDNDLDNRPADATSWTEHTIITYLQPPDAGGALPPGYGPFSFNVPITVIHVMYQ